MTLLSHPEIVAFLASRPNHGVPLKRFFGAAKLINWSQLLALTRPQAAQARDSMREQYAGASVFHAVSAARALLRYLADRGVVLANVLEGVRVDGAVSPIPLDNVLQPGQDEKILAAVKGPHAVRDYAVLAAILDHGFRASELANLTWENIYQEPDGRHTVTFIGKKGKPARMRMKPRTMEAVARLGLPQSGPFIPKKGTTPLTRLDIWAIVKRWGKAIGSPVTPHGLRATYISNVYTRTKDVRKAQKMARHGDLSSTERYLRHEVLDED